MNSGTVLPGVEAHAQTSGRSPAERIAHALRVRLWRTVELRIYVCPAERVRSLPEPRLMRRDCRSDLEAYQGAGLEQPGREEFLKIASERLAAGHHPYTYTEGGVLIHCGWLIDRQIRGEDRLVGLAVLWPENSAVLYDFFTHPSARGRGLYRAALQQCMHDAVEAGGAQQVYITVYGDNLISQRVIEKVGFTYQGSVVSKRRLLIRLRYGQFPSDALAIEKL